jgi:hypothetical protein
VRRASTVLRIARRTRRQPAAVLNAATTYFGPEGVGLVVSHRAADHVSLEGAGGFVSIIALGNSGGAEVTAVTRELEHDVRRFLDSL